MENTNDEQPASNQHRNEHPIASRYHGRDYPPRFPRPVAAPEDVLREERFPVERKTFDISLRKNSRGAFIRITERAADGYGKLNTVIIPLDGAAKIGQVIAEMGEQARAAGILGAPK